MFKIFKRVLIAVFVASFSCMAYAGGFQLFEQSGAGTGDYHAGGAAIANDASTEYYNPAGMVRLHHAQISFGGVIIPVDVVFHGTVSSFLGGGTTPPGGADSDTINVIPNFHLVIPVSKIVYAGFGVTVPFGLATHYMDPVAAIAASGTLLKTININPSIAVAVTKWLSVAFGWDELYGEADYDNIFQLPTGPAFFTNSLSGWGYGYNLGLLIQINPNTRIGVSYRSSIIVDADGRSRLNAGAGSPQPTAVSARLPLPATTIFSIFHNFNKQWAIMMSAYYTQWSILKQLVLENTAFFPKIVVKENYRNTWNLAVGALYHLNSKVTFKAGVGHDDTPTVDGYRDIRLPGADRFAIALGVHLLMSKDAWLDLGWTHFFASTAKIDNSKSSGVVPEVKGRANLSANVFAMQMTFNLR